MAFSISYRFIAHDMFTRVASRMVSSLGRINNTLQRTHRVSQSVARSFEHIRSVGAQAFVGLTLPLAGITAYGFKAAAAMEKLQVTISSATGSTEVGTKMLQKFVDFAARTPFQIEGVAETGKMLLGFGISTKEVIGTMGMLGDIAAGTGRPIKDLAFVYGQVRAKQKLLNEEIMQFSERGLPLLATLAKGTKTTVAEFQKLASKGKIPFEIFDKAMRQIHAEKYLNNMDLISKTLGGLLSNIKDKLFIAASAMFMHMDKMFSVKAKMQSFINFLGGAKAMMDKFVLNNPKIARLTFIFLGVLAVIPPLMIALGALGFVATLASTGIGVLAGAFAFLTSPISLAIIAVAAVAAAFYLSYDYLVKLSARIRQFGSETLATLSTKMKAMGASIKATFIEMGASIVSPFKFAMDTISGYIDKITAMKNKIVGSMSFSMKAPVQNPGVGILAGYTVPSANDFQYGTQPMTAGDLSTRSSIDINMTLNAPERTVQSIKSKQGGYGETNLGVSMGGR